jgi:hypothetical protein
MAFVVAELSWQICHGTGPHTCRRIAPARTRTRLKVSHFYPFLNRALSEDGWMAAGLRFNGDRGVPYLRLVRGDDDGCMLFQRIILDSYFLLTSLLLPLLFFLSPC